ncbi:hypothetical protein KKC04_03375 [Patescibacteria group bacterium]|nr:hypothetical protein [Patescibacteria group bacterium]
MKNERIFFKSSEFGCCFISISGGPVLLHCFDGGELQIGIVAIVALYFVGRSLYHYRYLRGKKNSRGKERGGQGGKLWH